MHRKNIHLYMIKITNNVMIVINSSIIRNSLRLSLLLTVSAFSIALVGISNGNAYTGIRGRSTNIIFAGAGALGFSFEFKHTARANYAYDNIVAATRDTNFWAIQHKQKVTTLNEGFPTGNQYESWLQGYVEGKYWPWQTVYYLRSRIVINSNEANGYQESVNWPLGSIWFNTYYDDPW